MTTSTETYDSTIDTQEHISLVDLYLRTIANQLLIRGAGHDLSKLYPPEKETFDRVTPQLRALTYGTPEYQEACAEIKETLEHHYQYNRHHVQHFENGIFGMTLIDLIEMFCDWCANTDRHQDGNIQTSLDINNVQFGVGDILTQVFRNTVKEFQFGKQVKD